MNNIDIYVLDQEHKYRYLYKIPMFLLKRSDSVNNSDYAISMVISREKQKLLSPYLILQHRELVLENQIDIDG